MIIRNGVIRGAAMPCGGKKRSGGKKRRSTKKGKK